ncbi:MAG: hypothetical protein AAFN08_01635 [Cyanobacteria bacterium J06559_3]
MLKNIFFDGEDDPIIFDSHDININGDNRSDFLPRGNGNDLTDGFASNDTADFSNIDFAIKVLARKQRELEALCSQYYRLIRQKG